MAKLYVTKHARPSKIERRCYRCRELVLDGEPFAYMGFKTGVGGFYRYWCKDHMQPKLSEMTSNPRLQTIAQTGEQVEEAIGGFLSDNSLGSKEDLVSALESAAEEIRGVAEEYTKSADNIEEGFGHATQQSDESREKGEALGEWADALESAAQEIRDIEPEPDEEPESKSESKDGEEDDEEPELSEDQINEIISLAEDALQSEPS